MEYTFESWTSENVNDQSGETVLITGANSGIGYFTALALAKAGARVIVAGRNSERVQLAVANIQQQDIAGSVEAAIVDLASLNSVRKFAQEFLNHNTKLDILINNAGVMMPPASKTEDGFESQFGINFIGHFALTGLLYNLLKGTPNSRVVTLSSIAHRGAHIDFDNLKLELPYDPKREYYQSKLADILFTLELARRSDAKDGAVLSVACHPGFTATELQRHLDPKFLQGLKFMETWQGSLPTLMAATSNDANQGDYYGPDGPGEMGGFPVLGVIDEAALDLGAASKLWAVAERETGVSFP